MAKFIDKVKIKNLNLAGLNSELQKQPSRVFKVSQDSNDLESVRQKEIDKLDYMNKTVLDRIEAKTRMKIRENFDHDQDLKLTEKYLDDMVKIHKKVIAYKKKIYNQRKKVRDINKLYNTSRNKLKSLVSKAESLVNIGFNLRKERDHKIFKESQKARVNRKLEDIDGD